MAAKGDEVKSTIKFQMKKMSCLTAPVGHMMMTDDELVYNVHLAVNFLVSLLKKSWQHIRALSIKSTVGKPQQPVLRHSLINNTLPKKKKRQD